MGQGYRFTYLTFTRGDKSERLSYRDAQSIHLSDQRRVTHGQSTYVPQGRITQSEKLGVTDFHFTCFTQVLIQSEKLNEMQDGFTYLSTSNDMLFVRYLRLLTRIHWRFLNPGMLRSPPGLAAFQTKAQHSGIYSH